MQRSASDFAIWMDRRRSALEPLQVPCVFCGDGHAHQDCPRIMAFEAAGDARRSMTRELLKTRSSLQPSSSGECGFPCAEASLSLASARRMNHQHLLWQQLTVPILAENGQVIDLRPVHNDAHCVWQQDTVPIIGENGEVVALRPAASSGLMRGWRQRALPMFNEQGDIVALPNGGRCEWPPEAVPILAESGEVIGFRPPALFWKQNCVPIFGGTGEVEALCRSIGNLNRWEQLTVPIIGENGEVIVLRPSGDHFKVPAPSILEGLIPDSTASSIGSNRTHLPLSLMQKIMKKNRSDDDCANPVLPHAAAPPSQDAPRWAQKGYCAPKAQSIFLTEPDFGSSLDVESIFSSSILSASKTCGHEDEPQRSVSECAQKTRRRIHTPELQPSHLDHIGLLAIPSTPGSPADSMASVNEILRLCNDARQATPDGLMLNVLQEALAPCAGNAGKLLSPVEPDVQDLVARLRQLPDLWRSTLLRMLEEAEAVQVTSGISPRPAVQ